MTVKKDIACKIAAIITAVIIMLSFSGPAKVYADGLEWGYGNPDKGVIWVLDNDTMTVYLNNDPNLPKDSLEGFPTDLPAPDSDEKKAVTQLFNNKGTGKEYSYRKVSNDKLLFTDEGALKNKVKTIVIKDGITGIGWKAKWKNTSFKPSYGEDYKVDQLNTGVFQDFDQLTTVVTCSSIKRIGWSALRKCPKLESFDFATCTDLEEIMDQAFSPSGQTNRAGLKEADLSECSNLKTIRYSAFNSISTLKSATLPGNLETLGQMAFSNCENLETVTFMNAGNLKNMYSSAFQDDVKLDEVIDEDAKKLAFTKPAAKKLFAITFDNNVFQNTALLENKVDLDIEVEDKTSPYSGSPQNGYGLTDEDHVSATGLVNNDKLTGEGYTPSSGTYAATYENGSFDTDSIGVKRGEYSTTDNYNADTVAPGKLTITKADLTITVKDQEYTYNGKEQGEDDTEYTDGSKVDAADIKGNDTVTGITLNGHKKDAGEYAGTIEAGGAAIGQDGAATNSYNISYVPGKLTIKPASLEIRTGSATKTYDGSALKESDAEIKGLQNGETADIITTGSQTSVGSSRNSYTIEWKSAKEGNYVIVKEDLGTLTVTAAPVPADDDDDNGGGRGGNGRRGGNRGGGGNAITPADGGTVAPDAPANTDINDDPVPAADTPEEPEDIDDPDVPLVDNVGWALINLLCMLATAVLFVLMLVRSIRKRQEGERAGIIYVIAGLAVAVFSALIFFMTEDMKLPMIMTDKWTLLMAVILAVQLAVTLIFRVRTADEDEEE